MTSTRGQRPAGLRLGSVVGAPVILGWSWFALAVILVVIAGQNLRSLGGTAYLIGLAYAVALLGSVLLHEIAHALAARSQGLRVARVSADLLGGHTAFEESPRSPGATAVVAVAGPATNLALAAAVYPLDEWLAGDPSTRVVALVVWGVMWANLVLGGFNLLPGMPLDGGRLVVALVWKLTGRQHAGWSAAGVLGVAVILGVLGWFVVWPLLQGERFEVWDLAWLVLVIPFLWRGARGSMTWGRWLRAVEGLTWDDVAEGVVVLDPKTSIREARAHPDIVLAQDSTGRASLVLGPAPEGVDVDLDTPMTALLIRIPDDCLLELSGDDARDLAVALRRSLADGGGGVVGLRDGKPVGIVAAQRASQVLAARAAN